MRRVNLGGLEVSAQGLGCMGMSEMYGRADWDGGIATIHRAIELGVTFIDTADGYGYGHNEVLVGRAIADRRDAVELATKVGGDRRMGGFAFRGEPEFVRAGCEASLLRLGVDVIDLYYLHRPPQTNPIEETIGAMAELVAEGKVRHLGVSEVSADELRRAHATHPIAAVQSEYSIWTRDPERIGVTDVLRAHGIALVPYAPLGRGYFTGTVELDRLDGQDMRTRNPRFVDGGVQANQPIVDVLADIAAAHGATPGQVALAWVAAQSARLGVPVVPIPGTKRVDRIEENAGATALTLSADDLAALDALGDRVVGARY